MKRIATSLLTLAIIVSGFTPVAAQKANKKDEQYKEIKALIESGSYEFTVQSVQPTGGKTIHSTSNYTMEANDSIFKAYLPYFGRAYQPSYGGNGGIEFEGSPENLEISLNEKKRMVNVQFKIQGDGDKYELFLSAGSSGYASLSINSQKRQPISYNGTIGPLKEKEKKEKKKKR